MRFEFAELQMDNLCLLQLNDEISIQNVYLLSKPNK